MGGGGSEILPRGGGGEGVLLQGGWNLKSGFDHLNLFQS